MEDYQLSSILEGHKLDVRCICPFPSVAEIGSGIISGSRDDTARLWCSSNALDNPRWELTTIYTGHTRYVSSVAYREPDDKFRQGLVYTGCLDGVIRAYEPENSKTHHTLEGHTGAVSSIYVSANKTLLTGSWDKTARVWLNEKSVTTLKGHEGAVWCAVILPRMGIMVTGSADYSLKLWKGGQCKRNITDAHTQAVRDIGVVSSTRFISCSNDGQILHWEIEELSPENIQAKVLNKFEDSDYVYSLSVFRNGDFPFGWVSSGENTGLKVFKKDGKLSQNILLPTQSVWCVTVLSNGDIAAGCSDHRIYIFTQDEKRVASSDKLAIYDAELELFKTSTNSVVNGDGGSGFPEEVGGVKVADMPIGTEALDTPGRRDGQTKMVKWPAQKKITAHSWSAAEQKWTLIGDVVGNKEGNSSGGKKETYQGKEYDHVFNIDIGDGVPPLKLPYNNDEEPYHVAQDFIHLHELPQEYLDEIAGFIVKNSRHTSSSQGVAADPLTGGGAYVSGSGGVQASSFTRNSGDPFTGSSAYTTSQPMDTDDDASDYFPQKTFLQFTQMPNIDSLVKKLTEFNVAMPEQTQVHSDELTRLVSLYNSDSILPTDITLLLKVLRWPRTAQNSPPFNPMLDIIRLAFVKPPKAGIARTILDSNETSREFTDIIVGYIADPNKPTNQMLALKVLVNIFSCDKGADLMCRLRETVLEHAGNLVPNDNKNCQIAISTLVLNYTIAATRNIFDSSELPSDDIDIDYQPQTQYITLISLLLAGFTDQEAKYRTLVALGTLIEATVANVNEAKKLDMKSIVKTVRMLVEKEHKVHHIANLIVSRL